MAIEWRDVTIDIKVCGVDVPPEDRDFVRLYPHLDPMLVSREEVDATKGRFRKKREKLQKFEYKLVQPDPADPVVPKVLPKLTCEYCGKSFSRRSTLEQHVALHGATNTTDWEEIQDAALHDLEEAAAFGLLAGELGYAATLAKNNVRTSPAHFPSNAGVSQGSGIKGIKEEAEEEDGADLAAASAVHNTATVLINHGMAVDCAATTGVPGHPAARVGDGNLGIRCRCATCGKTFARQSLLNRHHKLHAGIKPFVCNSCGKRFLQRYNLKKHLWTHSLEKPHKCECGSSYTDLSSLKAHTLKHHKQEGGHLSGKVGGQTTALPPPAKQTPVGDGSTGGKSGSSPLVKASGGGHTGPAVGNGRSKTAANIPCPKCDRVFAAKAHLDRHMPVHSLMVKPYSCHVCGWRFHLLHNMHRHLATHAKKGECVGQPPPASCPTLTSTPKQEESSSTEAQVDNSSYIQDDLESDDEDDGLVLTVEAPISDEAAEG